MKVIGQQRNSRMCVICGLDNQFGVRAPFYNMTDGSVASPFRYRAWHQSYPGRVHGGMITAMLDEMGLRGLWAAKTTTRNSASPFLSKPVTGSPCLTKRSFWLQGD